MRIEDIIHLKKSEKNEINDDKCYILGETMDDKLLSKPGGIKLRLAHLSQPCRPYPHTPFSWLPGSPAPIWKKCRVRNSLFSIWSWWERLATCHVIPPGLVCFLAQAATTPWYTSELLHTPSVWCSLLRGNTSSLACLSPPGSWIDPPTEWCLSWCPLGSETALGTKHIQTGTQSLPYMKEVYIQYMKENIPKH